jgi:cold-inducible RNA-binding protein
MNLYAGNLSRNVSEEDLRAAFEAFGQVSSVNIIKDKYTGESRGFGFVEMPVEADAKSAIAELNGKDLKGRTLNVNEARASKPSGDRRSPGGGRGPGRPGGGGPGRGGPRGGGGGGGGGGGKRYF